MIETLQDAAYQQMQAEVRQRTSSSQLPEAQEQALDEYPIVSFRFTQRNNLIVLTNRNDYTEVKHCK